MLHLVLITINNKPIGCLHCPNRNTGETGDIDGRKIFQTSKNQSYQISSKFTYTKFHIISLNFERTPKIFQESLLL